jgi:NADPH:quinone reductase-like Zn-dependent oxidoreductase
MATVEIDRPEPAADEVFIKVAARVNPVDAKMREGLL